MKYVCTVCGYIYEGDTPPEVCPKCKRSGHFVVFERPPKNEYEEPEPGTAELPVN